MRSIIIRQSSHYNQKLGSGPYTLHPGRNDTLPQLLRNSHRLTELFEAPVGVEGMYPGWSLGTWNDYQWILESGVYFALDLSHLNIVAKRERKQEINLLQELILSNKCLEIHVSGNNGLKDQHTCLNRPPWWFDTLKKAWPKSTAVLFTEGNQKNG